MGIARSALTPLPNWPGTRSRSRDDGFSGRLLHGNYGRRGVKLHRRRDQSSGLANEPRGIYGSEETERLAQLLVGLISASGRGESFGCSEPAQRLVRP
jgi:hypothetical protein